MVTINGERIQADGMTLLEFINKSKYNIERIAVEYNGEILPKDDCGVTCLKDGDVVEIVGFVGGG